MNRNPILRFRCLSLLPLCLAVSAQVISSNQPVPQGGPVSYASANQLNLLLGELEEAAAALKRALYIDQDFVLAHFALGNLNRQEGRKKESERNFGNALQLLEKRDPHEVLPEAEGMTAGRLAEIIRAMTKLRSPVNEQ